MNQRDIKRIQKMLQNRDAMVASVNEAGFPETKAMFLRQIDDVHIFWFSSNVSARSTGQWAKNPKASVYLVDAKSVTGVLFTGTMRVHEDAETKKAFWKVTDLQYYSQGPSDPDYCMLEFIAEHVRVYHWGVDQKEYTIEAFQEALRS